MDETTADFTTEIIEKLVNSRVNEDRTRIKFNRAVTVLRELRVQFVPNSEPYKKISEVLSAS